MPNRITAFVLSMMKTVALIAPHLRAILECIVRTRNGSVLSPDHIKLIGIDLDAFERKLVRLGLKFKTMKDEAVWDRVQRLYQGISTLENIIERFIFKPTIELGMIGQQFKLNEKTSKFLNCCFDEIQPSVMINARPASVSSDVFDHNLKRMFDDALMALTRAHPKRYLGKSGSLLLRDIQPFRLTMLEDEYESVKAYYNHYEVEMYVHSGRPVVTHAVHRPKSTYFNNDISETLYGMEVHEMTIYDIIKHGDVFLEEPNFGVIGLYSRVVGTSISSLDSILELYCLIGQDNYGRRGISKEFRLRFLEKGLPDVMIICSPMELSKYIKNLPSEVISEIHDRIALELELLHDCIFRFGMYRDIVRAIMPHCVAKMDENEFMLENETLSSSTEPARNASFDFLG